MNKPMIQPCNGQVISIGSIWADYCKGLISAECVSWAYLVGLDVFSVLGSYSDLMLYEAVCDDIEGYKDNIGDEDGLIGCLSDSMSDFRFWWAAHSRLNEPEELYEACYLLADKHESPSDFILERAKGYFLENLLETI